MEGVFMTDDKNKKTKKQLNDEYKKEVKEIQRHNNTMMSGLKRTKLEQSDTEKLEDMAYQKALQVLLSDLSIISPINTETVLKKDGQIQKYGKHGLSKDTREHLISVVKLFHDKDARALALSKKGATDETEPFTIPGFEGNVVELKSNLKRIKEENTKKVKADIEKKKKKLK